MKIRVLSSVFVALMPLATIAADRPRIYVTESRATQLAGEASTPEVKGSLNFTGGTSRENAEVIRAFAEKCPAVLVTADREKADFVVRLDHEELNPTTPFTRGNKVAVFDKNSDLIYAASTRTLTPAVKGACNTIAAYRK